MSMERVCPECGAKTEELTCPVDGEMTLVVRHAEDTADAMIGRVIGGRYRVVKCVGQGGFGAVYKATHTATGDTLAIKTLRTDVEGNSDVVARFRQEAKATSKLKHPNTVRVFDFGQMDDGNLFLAMEFLDGKTLTDLMRLEGPLDHKRLVHIALQVLKSLSEAHSKGLIHRDLKPDNIYLQNVHGEPDYVRVLDFGIAKSLSGDRQDITTTGAVIGTPKYMSPEQARGQPVDARTDLYSLGVILYEGLSGTPPFIAETPLAMILRRVTEDPPRVHDTIVRPTPVGLCDVVLRALSRRPENRYETADEMAAALHESLSSPVQTPVKHLPAGGPIPPPPSSTQAYGAGDAGIGDETVAVDGEGPATDLHVVVGPDDAVLDDATAVASADEIQQAADFIGRKAEAQSEETTGGDSSGMETVVAPIAAVAPSATDIPVSCVGPASASSQYPAIPAPRPSRAPWIIVGLVGISVAVGFGLFGLIRGQAVDAPAGSGRSGEVRPGASTGGTAAAAPAPDPKPAPAPAPAPPPKAPPKPDPKPEVQVQQATLVLVRTPADAIVQVDGMTVLGDRSILPPGKHTVVGMRTGYEKSTQEIDVKPGAVATVEVVLKKLKVRTHKPRPRPRPRPHPRPAPKPKPKPKPKPSGLLID